MRSIIVLQAGLRNPSTTKMLGEELAREVAAAFEARGQAVQVRTIDIRDHAHGIADTLLAGFSNPDLQQALDATAQADGLVVVTPTFSASYSGLFKSYIDILEPESLVGTPVVLAATGGTERHSLMIDHALRPLFAYLGAEPVRTGIFAATSDFGGTEGHITARIRRAAAELVTKVIGRPEMPDTGTLDASANGAATNGAAAPRTPKGFGEDLVPFEQLMGELGVGR